MGRVSKKKLFMERKEVNKYSSFTREALLKKATYLADKLNTKRRAFDKGGYLAQFDAYRSENLTDIYNIDGGLVTKTGNLTKGKKFYNKFSTEMLANVVHEMYKLHTNEEYGTVKKYIKHEKQRQDMRFRKHKKTMATILENLPESCHELIKDKGAFLNTFYELVKKEQERLGKEFGSEQLVRMALYRLEGREIVDEAFERAVVETRSKLISSSILEKKKAMEDAERNAQTQQQAARGGVRSGKKR